MNRELRVGPRRLDEWAATTAADGTLELRPRHARDNRDEWLVAAPDSWLDAGDAR